LQVRAATFFSWKKKLFFRPAQKFDSFSPIFCAGQTQFLGWSKLGWSNADIVSFFCFLPKIRVEKSGFNHFTCFETFFSLSAPGVGA
jgi:hypothetical protein